MDIVNFPIPLWVILVWWWVVNPAIYAMPEPNKTSSALYQWLYKFANGVAGNFQESLKGKLPPEDKK